MIWNVTQWHSYPSKRQINPPETPLGTYHGSIKINWIRHNWIHSSVTHKCNILSKNNILRAFFFPGTRPLTMILTEVSICFSCIYKYHKKCSTVVKCSWCAVCQSVHIYYLLHCYTLYFMSFCFYLWCTLVTTCSRFLKLLGWRRWFYRRFYCLTQSQTWFTCRYTPPLSHHDLISLQECLQVQEWFF